MENRSSIIELKTLFHRGKKWIGLYFKFDRNIISKVKSIEGRKYSKTNNCWYIPNTNEAFTSFKALNISFNIIDESKSNRKIEKKLVLQENYNSEEQQNLGTRQSPMPSDLSHIDDQVSSLSEHAKEGGKHPSDIQNSNPVLEKVVIQNKMCHIKIKWSIEETTFLRTLQKAYWDNDEKLWKCRFSGYNLKKIQDRYHYWEKNQYLSLFNQCPEFSPFVKVVAVVGSNNQVEIKARHVSSELIDMIKCFPDRVYQKDSRSWLIPRDKDLVDQVEAYCKKLDYPFRSRVTFKPSFSYSKSRNGNDKQKFLLAKVSSEWMPVMELFTSDMLRRNYSFNSIKQYSSTFYRFLKTLKDENALNNYTPSSLKVYMNKIVQKDVSSEELNRHLSATKYYFNHIARWPEVELDLVKRPKRPKKLPRIMSTNQVKLLFQQTDNIKHKSMLYLAYGCGLRSGEIVNIKIHDIFFDRNQIFVRGGKGNKDRTVMLPEKSKDMLKEYFDKYRPDYWLFQGANHEKSYSQSSLRVVFKRALKKAGLDTSLKLHSLRHSFATHLMESGTQQRLIQTLLGHASSKTTEIYTHVTKSNIENVKSPLDNLL